MKTIYFDDLFLIIHNEGYTLCEHVPYEQHRELLTVDLNQQYETPEQLIHYLIKSVEFSKLRLEVLGISHNFNK